MSVIEGPIFFNARLILLEIIYLMTISTFAFFQQRRKSIFCFLQGYLDLLFGQMVTCSYFSIFITKQYNKYQIVIKYILDSQSISIMLKSLHALMENFPPLGITRVIKDLSFKFMVKMKNNACSDSIHIFQLIKTMQETIGSQRFSFGQVQDTEYIPFDVVDNQIKLPYNPFVFDMKLIIHKSRPNYEEAGTEYPLSHEKTIVFCRKKKIQKQWTDPNSTPIYLNAQIVSQKHFSINSNNELKDQNSKKGTYFWIDRYHPLKIQSNDIFLIGKQPFTINKIMSSSKPMIQATYQGNTIEINDSRKLFLIGSHKKCNLIVPSLYEFQVCINLSNFTIFTNLDEQQACSDHGLWYRMRNNKPNSSLKLQYGNLFMVQPYIFKVIS